MTLIASCHCGKIKVELPRSPTEATDCNCSYCLRAGAVWGYFPAGELRFISVEQLSTYSASGGVQLHHFCDRCGIEVWAETPDWTKMAEGDGSKLAVAPEPPRRHAVNLRTVDNLDWSMIMVEKVDGRSNW